MARVQEQAMWVAQLRLCYRLRHVGERYRRGARIAVMALRLYGA